MVVRRPTVLVPECATYTLPFLTTTPRGVAADPWGYVLSNPPDGEISYALGPFATDVQTEKLARSVVHSASMPMP